MFQYLTARKVVEIEGDMTYKLHGDDDSKHKYYAIKNANVQLITDLPAKKDASEKA